MFTEQDAKNEVEQAMAGLPPKSQRRVAKKMIKKYQSDLSDTQQNIEKLKVDLALKQVELSSVDSLVSFFEGMEDWDEVILEKNTCSRLHHLKDAFKNGRMIEITGHHELDNVFDIFENTFVVKHDWRSVLDGLDIQDSEVCLPYDNCAFEFRISGMTIIALARSLDHLCFRCFVQSAGYWCAMPEDQNECTIGKFVWQQIKSICVALDADVACDEVVRAPHKLNEKRERKGKTKLADYHVVDLAKRHRISNPSSGESGTKVRLHFRRGHWRHYEDYKSWIKWCLVGDPDLGFISKHYTI